RTVREHGLKCLKVVFADHRLISPPPRIRGLLSSESHAPGLAEGHTRITPRPNIRSRANRRDPGGGWAPSSGRTSRRLNRVPLSSGVTATTPLPPIDRGLRRRSPPTYLTRRLKGVPKLRADHGFLSTFRSACAVIGNRASGGPSGPNEFPRTTDISPYG